MAIDYGKDNENASGGKVTTYCFFEHCKTYWRDGIFIRSRGHVPVEHVDGRTVYLCQACYQKWMDRRGLSVNAITLRDPESIPSLIAAQLKRDRET